MNSYQTSVDKGDILIVDDTADNLRLLSSMLKSHGYRVRTSISGQLALKGANIAPPDLILLDINMPQMNGYEVCEKLKLSSQTYEIPVIFISALDQVLDKVKAFQVGGVDYITKPFQLEEVLARVESQLTVRAQQKRLQQQTQELQQQNVQLELTLDQLKRTQAQLIQSEKMSSLGQMVAGVAHEINNPIGFIYGNLAIARAYFEDLSRLIQIYQQTYPNPTREIQDVTSEIDLNFLMGDWQKLINSMQVGAERIHQIVRSLQIFSRHNNSDIKPVDIHEGIDNTLLILQHRLRAEGDRPSITIIKHYGQLPRVTCYASQLNQVFMNLLSNAVDALEVQPEPRLITICTQMVSSYKSVVNGQEQQTTDSAGNRNLPGEGKRNLLPGKEAPSLRDNGQLTTDKVVIRISDNGPGMSEKVLNQIFNPFFTTKPVGSGTGLGLSISHQIIVEKHGGQLSCVSALGQGTEFTVEIPLRPKFSE